MAFAATLLEPLTECIMLSIIGFASLNHLIDVSPWLFFIIHYVLWLFVDFDVNASLANHPVPSENRLAFMGAWAARELLAFPIWSLAILGDKVEWRGKTYRILPNGEVEGSECYNEPTSWLLVGWDSRRTRKDCYESLNTNDN
jgi:ceramide glucosyltransferase